MRFLCDMGVSRRVSEWLLHQDHESVHLGDEGLARLPNGAIFSKALAESRVVLTFDLDFGEILASTGGLAPSVVIFRLRNTRAEHVIQRLAVAHDKALDALHCGDSRDSRRRASGHSADQFFVAWTCSISSNGNRTDHRRMANVQHRRETNCPNFGMAFRLFCDNMNI